MGARKPRDPGALRGASRELANLSRRAHANGWHGRRGLAFDPDTERGVVFHLLGALAEYGKVGAVCIAPSRHKAQALFDETVAMLDEAAV